MSDNPAASGISSLPTRRLPYAASAVLVAAVYFVAARLSLNLAIPPGYATAVWPPSGIAVAAVLLIGMRVWPGVWIGAALANLGVEASLLSATIMASGNTLEAIVAATLIRRFAGNPGGFQRGDEVLRFVAAAAIGACVAASVALLPLALRHGLTPGAALRNWWTWWQGDFSGILVLTPLVLSWCTREGLGWPWRKKLEAASFILLLAAAAVVISSDEASHFVPFSLTFIALPFILWAAFRFGQREVSTAVTAVSAVAVWHTVRRSDLFASSQLNELLLMLLTFIGMVVTTGLVLAAELAERRRTAESSTRRQSELESQLERGAHYDALTGLPNARLFQERVAQLVEGAGPDQKVALAVLDLERFKLINDSFGRHAADDLLRLFAARLASGAGPRMLVARTGGDRFALAAPVPGNESGLARMVETGSSHWFGEPYALSTAQVRLSGRLGLALSPDDGNDVDTLLLRAESALKKAKATGERYLFYTETMSERVAEKLALESKLRAAIEREEFVLHYQPKVDLTTRQVVGLEALIRWRSPELGMVAPLEFIPLLEETGMILEVGRWAMARAVRDQKLWAAEGIAVPRVAVNVSAIELRQRDFVDTVRAALSGHYLIDLEITESRIMEDIDSNIEKLQQLSALGIGIAIDDFGTGYSSLAYLAKLPVRTLKIDRSFIAGMLRNDETMAVVQTVISLAQSLRLTAVAEGVETEEQADMLALLCCDQMQGYFVSRPQPRERISALLRAG